MGTSRDGRVSKNFGTGDSKIKVRFANEHQARRVAVFIEYLKVAFRDGMTLDEAVSPDNADFAKAREVIEKIEEGHSHEH